MRLTLASTEVAAGTYFQTYRLHNTGDACTLFGYPGFSVLDDSGRVIGQPADRDHYKNAKLVGLHSGQTAQFIVHGVNDVDGAGCPENFGSGVTVRVYPPNRRTALFLQTKTGSCKPQVSPVTKTGS